MFDDAHIDTIGQIQTFLDAADVFDLHPQCSTREKVQWIYERLVRFKYSRLGKKDKGIVCRYLRTVTGYSERQLKRHIAAYTKGKKLCTSYKRHTFSRTYTEADKELLAETIQLSARVKAGQAPLSVVAVDLYGNASTPSEALRP